MKKCSYCGLNNEEAALGCTRCGTPFEAATPELAPQALEEQISGRPKGIWIVSIWVGLFAGLLPLSFAFIIQFGPTPTPDLIPKIQFIPLILLALASLGFAVGALFGQVWARYGLVVAAVLHWGGVAWNNYVLATNGGFPNDRIAAFWLHVVTSIITPILIAWYLFVSSSAKGFFAKETYEG
jgi:hypothetical protein